MDGRTSGSPERGRAPYLGCPSKGVKARSVRLVLSAFMAISGVATASFVNTLSVAAGPGFSVEGSVWGVDENGVPCGNIAGASLLVWNACRVGFYTTGTLNSLPNFQSNAYTAADRWTFYDSSRNLLDFQYDLGRSNGSAVVSMDVADLGGPHPDGITTIGLTYMTANGGFFRSASIVMTTHSTVTWCYSGCPMAGAVTLVEAMEHELGHALGLDHPVHGTFGGSVMQCVQAGNEATYIQPDDQNGEAYLYSNHGSDFGSPHAKPC
jgi:hypothetical protein